MRQAWSLLYQTTMSEISLNVHSEAPSQKKILLIENDPHIAILLNTYINDRGYQVVLATSAKDAMRILEFYHPHLILSEIMLPRMDGFEFCKLLKRLPEFQNLPFVFISPGIEKWASQKSLGMGAQYCLQKPFHLHEVIQTISHILK